MDYSQTIRVKGVEGENSLGSEGYQLLLSKMFSDIICQQNKTTVTTNHISYHSENFMLKTNVILINFNSRHLNDYIQMKNLIETPRKFYNNS